MPKISLQKRRQVINLYKQKWNICRISKELSIISSTVLRIIKKYQTFGTVEDRKRPGRNRKITEKMKKIVVWTAKKDPFLNSTEIKKELTFEISASYIRRILVSSGLKAKICPKKPLISDVNRQKRLTWCREKMRGFPWKNVIFSDETMMELQPTRRIYVRRPKNKRFNQKYVLKHRLIPSKKLMLWGCIRSNGEKIIVPIKNKVDASCYIQILKDHALNFLDLHEIFQQDNAPAHSAEKTRIFFEENAFVCLENWPPQSPDLNIIENLWSVLKKAVSRRNPRNLDELLSFSQEEFAKIPKDYVQKLYDSIPSRLTLVLQNNGYATKY